MGELLVFFQGICIILSIQSVSGDHEADADGEISRVECEEYDTGASPCQESNCTRRKLCVGSPKAFCFATWKNIANRLQFIAKGCWSSNEYCVNSTVCIQSPSMRHLNFCCCREPMCNSMVIAVNYTPSTLPIQTSSPKIKGGSTEDLTKSSYDLWICVVSILSALATLSLIALLIICCLMQRPVHRQLGQFTEASPVAVHRITQELPVECHSLLIPSTQSSSSIRRTELLARGSFADVWKAELFDDIVAVKVFPLRNKKSWLAEKNFYKLSYVNHENILKCIGTEARCENENYELYLVTEYHANGSLYDYLKENTLSWSALCSIAESMLCGLSFLHGELLGSQMEEYYYAIAHRDFKSKNVLIKSNLTACIADFGLAVVFEPGESLGESFSLVGTMIYMAPELLERSISYNRDSFLRVDMYACGLVLWELMSRCTAVEDQVSEHQLPFEDEVGQKPTLEDMKALVVAKKIRPRIDEHWLKHAVSIIYKVIRNYAGMKGLAATATECWDHDSEARLTADCVLERISQLCRQMISHTLSKMDII